MPILLLSRVRNGNVHVFNNIRFLDLRDTAFEVRAIEAGVSLDNGGGR